MPRALRSRKTNWTQHACTYMCFVVRTLIGTNLVCCLVQGGLRCALLCSWFNVIHTRTYYILLYCSAVKQLLYTGTAVPPATLARKEACIGITDRCKVDGSTFSVKTGDLPMPRALRSRKTNWTQHACTCLLYTSPSPRDLSTSRMPSSA